jgi:glucosyl-dolichyl phosphate glucuronosyltransferase
MPDISVVICAYTSERWTDICAAIESVRGQTLPARETILVVDHNPELLERSRAEFSDVVVVPNTGPQGLSGARNSGTAAASGSVIAYLDDDAFAESDWLERLAKAYTDPRVQGVGGHIEPMWLTRRPRWFPDEFKWVVGCAYTGLPTRSAPVRNLIGANMSFRRAAIDAVGGFRAEVGRIGAQMLHCEDTEFCIRLQQHWPDAILLHEPAAIVHHRVPAGRTRWAYFRVRCYTEGQAKARVSRMVGARDGLSSERGYVVQALPRGVARGLVDAVIRHDVSGPLRAGAIVAGLALTGAGYLTYRLLGPAPA